MMLVSSCGPVSTADAVVSSRVGNAAESELTMRVPSFGPMGVIPSKPIGLFVLPTVTSDVVVSLRVGDAAVSKLMT